MSEYLRLGEAILHVTSPDFLDTKPNPKTNPDPYATIMIKIRLYLDLRFLAAMLVYYFGTPTWRLRVNRANT